MNRFFELIHITTIEKLDEGHTIARSKDSPFSTRHELNNVDEVA